MGAVARRKYATPLELAGVDLTLHRLLHAFAWFAIATLAGWAMLFSSLGASDANLDGWIWSLQIASAICFPVLAACALAIMVRGWTRPRHWFARSWSALRAAGAVSVLWVTIVFHLIAFGANY